MIVCFNETHNALINWAFFRPGLQAPREFERKEISGKHKETLEKLKSRPRKRPDWSDMMKEVESGRKLRHVECNDRSNPILKSGTITNMKGQEQFVYESEKANVHNALLQQIQGGLRLKPTKTNDRSKPVLGGSRKFRKQMTIEEQIQKSESRAQLGSVAPVDVSHIGFELLETELNIFSYRIQYSIGTTGRFS